MTVEMAASSSVRSITEMLTSSDAVSNTAWPAVTPFVWLPVSDFVCAQFKDSLANVTGGYSDTLGPSGPPTAPLLDQVFLALALREGGIEEENPQGDWCLYRLGPC